MYIRKRKVGKFPGGGKIKKKNEAVFLCSTLWYQSRVHPTTVSKAEVFSVNSPPARSEVILVDGTIRTGGPEEIRCQHFKPPEVKKLWENRRVCGLTLEGAASNGPVEQIWATTRSVERVRRWTGEERRSFGEIWGFLQVVFQLKVRQGSARHTCTVRPCRSVKTSLEDVGCADNSLVKTPFREETPSLFP